LRAEQALDNVGTRARGRLKLKHALTEADTRVRAIPMSTIDQTTEPAVADSTAPAGDLDHEPTLALELSLSDAEALRAWLLKPAQDGTTSLDDPRVSHTLSELGLAVDTVLATVNVRRELKQAGLEIDHLSDEQVRELGRRVAEVATPGMRH
jgi:hypothetical protein